MIELTFTQPTAFDTSIIHEARWRERVKNTPLSTGGYRVTIGVDVDDSSYRQRRLMERPQLVLKFNLPYFVEFPVGTTCLFQNQKFSLNNPENLKKQGKKNIEYTMTMGTQEDNLGLYKLRNSVDGRLKWTMCAKPHEFVEEICRSLNARDGEGVWFCDKSHIIEATEKTIEFSHVYCDSALASVAETFETEYEVIDHNNGTFEIILGKVEYFKENPLPLSYGKGNGFIPGIGRAAELDGTPIKRLYVQGGDRNIDRSKYGETFGYTNKPAELRLPRKQVLDYEDRQYITDDQGYYIERHDKPSTAVKEDSLDCPDNYPSYIGNVSRVEEVDPKNNFWDIFDTYVDAEHPGIPANLDFSKHLIEGEDMTLIFQSGMLAEKEFDVKYRHDERRWELVPMEEDGITIPNETFRPVVGDKYAVFGITLPDAYICDNASKTGAAWEMFKEAAKYLYEHEDQKFTFSGELQALYAKRNWLKIGGYLKVGAFIHFTDEQFAVDGVDIRIIGIKDFVNSPYSPTLEISNGIQSPSSVSSQLQQIDNTEVQIDDTKKSLIQFTKRRFRDAKETISMLEEALLENFTESITPISVQAMSLLIGDESLQFEFGTKTSRGGWMSRTGLIQYNNDTQTLVCNMSWAGEQVYLRHMTLGQDSITSAEGRENAEYKTWPMNTFNSPTLAEPEKRYYLYARVSREDLTERGTFVLSETAIEMTQEDGYYHLLTGILNSEYDGERSFVTLYGFTEILPGRITTDIITTGSGESFFDLVENAFKLGDNLSYNINKDGVLRLKGTLVQSPSGDEFPMPCFRGAYSGTTHYFYGDVVTYSSGGNTSNYICIFKGEGVVGIPPINSPISGTYWKLYTQGTKGNPGDAGQDGRDAPILVFRGNFDPTKAYYGNASRVDCVKYGATYYVAKITAPGGTTGFAQQYPDAANSQYWQSFGASFESVATSLLLAERATIGNWYIENDSICSTHGTIDGKESDDFTNSKFRPDVILDGATGELVLYNDTYPRVRISNQSIETMYNESLQKEARIGRTLRKTIDSTYIPVGGSEYKIYPGLIGKVTIGQMTSGSTIQLSQCQMEFTVPYMQDGSTLNASVNGVDFYVNIKKGDTVMHTFKGQSGTSTSSSNRITQPTLTGTYTVESNGEYSVEVYLTSIQFTTPGPGYFRAFDITTSVILNYSLSGFNRTIIGNDGIGSFWEKSAFVFTPEYFIAKFGKIGLKVSENGIQRSGNADTQSPTWQNLV